MDANKEAAIEKIFRLASQDSEFDAALRKKLDIAPSPNVVASDRERINEIYELCIEQITRKQGKEFYADFPIASLRPQLAEDYNRMERFRRKDNFYDFSLAMYQQIENITNYICADPKVEKVALKMWAYPAYIKTGKDVKPTLENRHGNYLIAQLLFPSNTENIAEYLRNKTLSKLYATNKMRNVVYFIGYKAEMKSSDFDYFKEICNLLYELYQCRNMVHRNARQSEESDYLRRVQEKINSMKSFYYSKFHGLLSQYVEFIKNNYPMNDKLINYADSLEDKPIPHHLRNTRSQQPNQ